MHKFGDEELSRAAGRIWSEGQSSSLIQKSQSGSTTLSRPPLSHVRDRLQLTDPDPILPHADARATVAAVAKEHQI